MEKTLGQSPSFFPAAKKKSTVVDAAWSSESSFDLLLGAGIRRGILTNAWEFGW